MVSEFPVKPLGEITRNFDRLRVPVKKHDRKTGPYPYYGASGIADYIDGYIFEGLHLLIAEDGENLKTKKTPIAFLADGKFWVNNHAHIVQGNDLSDTNYIHQALQVVDISPYLSGSTRPKLTQKDLNRILVPSPRLSEQKRIAAMLGALDDKIELNRKMNKTLEAMAQAIFKNWFVDFEPFRDAGMDDSLSACEHAQAGELGSIPKGWKIGNLGNVISIYDSKRIPLSKKQRSERPGPFPYYGATSIMDYVDDYLFDGVYALIGEDGSVVDEKDKPIVQYVWGKFWVNNHAHVLLPKKPFGIEWLVCFLRQLNIRPFITGAVQLKLNQGNLKRIPVIIPHEIVCRQFNELAEPLYSKYRANADEILTLSELRDNLLPKLISGEIRVPEAECKMEKVA